MEKKTEQVKEIKDLNIFEKMDMITNDLGIVAKGLNVQVTKTSSYKAVSERDILDNVKPLEHKYRVYSYPYDRKIVESDILTTKNDYGEKNSLYMRIETIYRFINLDNTDEFMDIKTYGDGIDTGDKATGKAMTYSDKYALMKGYKISTGDDPDKEASPEKGYTKQTTENNIYLKIKKLMQEKNVLPNEISEHFNKNSADMTQEELEEVVKWLEEK